MAGVCLEPRPRVVEGELQVGLSVQWQGCVWKAQGESGTLAEGWDAALDWPSTCLSWELVSSPPTCSLGNGSSPSAGRAASLDPG